MPPASPRAASAWPTDVETPMAAKKGGRRSGPASNTVSRRRPRNAARASTHAIGRPRSNARSAVPAARTNELRRRPGRARRAPHVAIVRERPAVALRDDAGLGHAHGDELAVGVVGGREAVAHQPVGARDVAGDAVRDAAVERDLVHAERRDEQASERQHRDAQRHDDRERLHDEREEAAGRRGGRGGHAVRRHGVRHDVRHDIRCGVRRERPPGLAYPAPRPPPRRPRPRTTRAPASSRGRARRAPPARRPPRPPG